MSGTYSRNINIDLARCLACLGVVGLHGIGMTNYTLYYFCSFSVPMFFMISGYLMFKKDRIDYRYSVKKALSYIRLIVCWNIILAVPIMVLKRKFVNPLAESVKNLFQKGYLWHFWYFGAMLVTLLLLPIVHTLLKKYVYLHVAAMIILFAACLIMTSLSWKAGFPNQSFVPQFLRIWVFGLYFLFGGFWGVHGNSVSECGGNEVQTLESERMISRGLEKNRKFKYVLLLFFVVLTYVSNTGQKHLGNYAYHNRIADNFYDEGTVVLWCMVFFVLIMVIKIIIPVGLIEGFARLSLGVFILHPLVLKGIEVLALPDNTLFAIIRWALAIFISAAATFIMLKIPYIKKLVEL